MIEMIDESWDLKDWIKEILKKQGRFNLKELQTASLGFKKPRQYLDFLEKWQDDTTLQDTIYTICENSDMDLESLYDKAQQKQDKDLFKKIKLACEETFKSRCNELASELELKNSLIYNIKADTLEEWVFKYIKEAEKIYNDVLTNLEKTIMMKTIREFIVFSNKEETMSLKDIMLHCISWGELKALNYIGQHIIIPYGKDTENLVSDIGINDEEFTIKFARTFKDDVCVDDGFDMVIKYVASEANPLNYYLENPMKITLPMVEEQDYKNFVANATSIDDFMNEYEKLQEKEKTKNLTSGEKAFKDFIVSFIGDVCGTSLVYICGDFLNDEQGKELWKDFEQKYQKQEKAVRRM